MSNTIYDLLTGVKIDAAKTSDLDSATSRTFIDRSSVEFWNPILLLSHVIRAARTYAHGLPIPEAGAVWTEEIANGATANVQPSGTEVWRIENIDLDSCAVAFNDGTSINPFTPSTAGVRNGPYFITNTLFLTFSNSSGSNKDPSVGYSKVSL
jgi:hypothetical protein